MTYELSLHWVPNMGIRSPWVPFVPWEELYDEWQEITPHTGLLVCTSITPDAVPEPPFTLSKRSR